MFKSRNFKYSQGKRSSGLQKLKGQNTIDGFVSGFIEPTKGGRNQNVIGGLIFSAYVDGIEREIANVSGISDADRQKMTLLVDGTPILKDSYYGKVAELIGNNWSRTGKLVHPRINDWREDRSPQSCQLTSDDIKSIDR